MGKIKIINKPNVEKDLMQFSDIKVINNINIDSDILYCSICKDLFDPEKTIQLDCCHMFCEDCIKDSNNYDSGIKYFVEVNCPLCDVEEKWRRIKDCNKFAYNIICDVTIECPNESCKEIISNGKLNKHLEKCEYKLMDCPYCDKKNIFRKDLKQHLVDNMGEHFLALIDEVENLKSKKLF